MNFKQYGKKTGKNIVFLLGANNEPSWYEDFFQALGRFCTVYAINYPGIGNSNKLSQHTLDNYLTYIHKLIKDEIGVSEYFLGGFSLGAYLAIEYKNKYQEEKIRGLILLSPMLKLKSNNIFSLACRFMLNEISRIKRAQRSKVYSFTLHKNLRYLESKIWHTKFAINLPAMTQDRIPNTPYLAILGDKDLIIDIEYVQRQLDKNKTIIYEGLGHDGFALEASKTTGLIQNFMQRERT